MAKSNKKKYKKEISSESNTNNNNSNSLVALYNRFYGIPSALYRNINKGWTVLDIGCGKDSPLQHVKKDMYKVGLDYYKPYIAIAQKKNIHNRYIHQDLRKLDIPKKSFDCVIATEVIEHLSEKDGINLIKNMENIAKFKIILTTPNGLLETEPGHDDNPDELHISGWETDFFKKNGFTVRGVNGLKILWTLKNGKAVMRAPRFLFTPLRLITEPIAYYFPKTAFQIACSKKLTKY